MTMTHNRLRRPGFTLLELSIVLAVVSLIAGVGISIATNALKAADRITTQEKLATLKAALESYALSYGYLPCPARLDLTPTSSSSGLEARSGSTSCAPSAGGLVAVNNIFIGNIPVRTLGLPDHYAADAWGGKITYAVSAPMVANAISYAGSNSTIAVRFGTRASNYNVTQERKSLINGTVGPGPGPVARVTFTAIPATLTDGTTVHVNGTTYKGSFTVSGRTGTTIDLNSSTYSVSDNVTVEWQEPGLGAAFVVVSHGPDGRGAIPLNGTLVPATKLCVGVGANTSPPPCTSSAITTCIDIENCNNDEIFFDTTYKESGVADNYFDDFIVWGSNALKRTAVSQTLYTACPSGVCEAWCARCAVNYPNGGSTLLSTGLTNPSLCKKTINTNATSCSANCFWSGTSGSGYVECP